MFIVYNLNNKFVPQVAASICSICETNSDTYIYFYLLTTDLTIDNVNILKKFVNNYNNELHVVRVDLNKYFNYDFDTLGWNDIVITRMLLGWLLPDDIEKIIYLDGDTIVLSSLKELWKTNLYGKTVGMVKEPTANKNRRQQLCLANYSYYNSGVILIDLIKWRYSNISKKLVDFYKEKNGMLFAPDQDAINYILRDEIYSLEPKYNYCNIYEQYSYIFLSKLEKPRNYFTKEIFDKSKKNPVIVHFLGEERPWRNGNAHRFKDEYDKYLNKTPYKGQNYEDGWNLYFQFWYLFNIMTKPFPAIRYKIVDTLIPVVMRIRHKKINKLK